MSHHRPPRIDEKYIVSVHKITLPLSQNYDSLVGYIGRWNPPDGGEGSVKVLSVQKDYLNALCHVELEFSKTVIVGEV